MREEEKKVYEEEKETWRGVGLLEERIMEEGRE